MGSEGMRVYDVSLLVSVHASKVKITLKADEQNPEISPETAIMMTHQAYGPYRGKPIGGVMSNDKEARRMKITIAPLNGGEEEGWIDVISTPMVAHYLKGVLSEGDMCVISIKPTLHAVGRHPECPSRKVF